MVCRLFLISAMRGERESEEGREKIGRAQTRVEEARRMEKEWRGFMMEVKRGRGYDGVASREKWVKARACFVEIEGVEGSRKTALLSQ